MSTLDLQIYELLKSRFGEKEAAMFIEYIEQKTEDKVKSNLSPISNTMATKENLSEVKFDLIKWMVTLFITLALMIIGLYFK